MKLVLLDYCFIEVSLQLNTQFFFDLSYEKIDYTLPQLYTIGLLHKNRTQNRK